VTALAGAAAAVVVPSIAATAAAAFAVAFECAALKLPHARPLDVPYGLRGAVTAALFPRGAAPPLSLEACVQPGCMLLTFDAVLDDGESGGGGSEEGAAGAGAGDESEAPAAARDVDARAGSALRAMLSHQGAAGAFLRTQPAVQLSMRGGSAAAAYGVVEDASPRPLHAPPRPPPPPRLPPLTPIALLCGAPALLRFTHPPAAAPPLLGAAGGPERASAAAASAELQCRLHGQYVTLRPLPPAPPTTRARASAAAQPPAASLPALHVEGVALFGTQPDAAGAGADDARGASAAAPRPVLLCADAAIVTEVAVTEAALAAMSAADGAVEAERRRHALEAAVLSLGMALRPGCSPALLARAAAGALRHGWAAAAARALGALAQALDAAEGDAAAAAAAGAAGGSAAPSASLSVPPLFASAALAPRGVTLLHAAAASGRADLTLLVMRLGGVRRRFGAADSVGPGGATPLHYAAVARDAGAGDGAAAAGSGAEGDAAAAAATGAGCVASALTHPARGDAAADALVAWFTAADGDGRVPSHFARAPGAPSRLRTLDDALRVRMRDGMALARAVTIALQSDEGVFLPPELAARGGDVLLRGAPGAADDAAAAAAAASEDTRRTAAALMRAAAAAWEARQEAAEVTSTQVRSC
jgi:hypothetical protein